MSRWVYGPVGSRRFGLSLGVDLAPRKVCSYDCVYCQVGRTTDHTAELQHFGDLDEILDAVAGALARGPRPEVITLAGSGEPTLYDDLAPLVGELKVRFGLPVVLLTNGSLLWRPEVAAAVQAVDILAPSLDAGDEATFRALNRPAPGVSFDLMVRGLRDVAAVFPGTVRVEVMLVRGANDRPDRLRAIARVLDGIRADVIDVNTVVRPTPRTRVQLACDMEVLRQAAALFGPRAVVVPTEADLRGRGARRISSSEVQGLVLDFVRRRPATVRELSEALALGAALVAEAVEILRQHGLVVPTERAGETFVLPARKH